MRFGLPDSFTVVERAVDLDRSFSILSAIDTPIAATLFHLAKLDVSDSSSNSTSSPSPKPDTVPRTPYHDLLAQANISQLQKDTEHYLSHSHSQLSLFISQEQERIRRENERIRKEQERLRQEQERKQRLEQERQRQLELERQRLAKEAEERERKQQELKKQQEAERQRELERERQLQEEKEKAEKERLKQNKNLDVRSAENALAEFEHYTLIIADIKTSIVQPVLSGPNKSAVSQVRRRLKPKFGQISRSKQQIIKVAQEIIALTQPVQADPLSYKYVLNIIAKGIVSQAESEVVVSPERGLQLAYLSCALLQSLPQLEYFLSARLVKKCPYIVGYHCPTDEEPGRIRMGWKKVGSEWEDRPKYNERVAGICTLWALMCVDTTFPLTPFFSSDAAWKFLARLVNIGQDSVSSTHYAVATNWWEAAAYKFLPLYGLQSVKLLTLVVDEWAHLGQHRKFPEATRLNLLGMEWEETHCVKLFPPLDS